MLHVAFIACMVLSLNIALQTINMHIKCLKWFFYLVITLYQMKIMKLYLKLFISIYIKLKDFQLAIKIICEYAKLELCSFVVLWHFKLMIFHSLCPISDLFNFFVNISMEHFFFLSFFFFFLSYCLWGIQYKYLHVYTVILMNVVLYTPFTLWCVLQERIHKSMIACFQTLSKYIIVLCDYMYTMQNKFSNCFCVCQIHHIRLLLSDYCIKISKKISNDQELIQSDPISCPQNQKGNN